MAESSDFPSNYLTTLELLKTKIADTQYQAAMSVNTRLIYLYWQVGCEILEQQSIEGWGAKVISQLANDLSAAFPSMKGFSVRNLSYMRQFAQEWDFLIVQQPAAQIESGDESIMQQPAAQIEITENETQNTIMQQAAAQIENAPKISFDAFEKLQIAQIPWSHHMLLLDKLNKPGERLFYCKKIIENGWSRKVLLNQTERSLHLQQGALTHNFNHTLPKIQSELARDTFKDPYFFDFLQLGDEAKEKEVEDKLVGQITDFLLELGAGFAYMGRQYKLEVGGKDFFLDLLFYHVRLRCYVVIELKIGEFKPEYVGKVQFYLAALDDLVKIDSDNASIGLILVKEANRVIAEYALRDSSKPIGVAGYKIVDSLPENLKQQLPSIEQIEQKLSK
ncbi:MAG: DUF1016 domain-containing protein [Bacteroidia bacterium]|nr:DUF1016 domain-containing protein [Bacteroidia bacterium]